MDVNFPIGAAAMDPCLALYCEGVRIDAETQTILDSAPSGADSELQQELARSKTRLKERLNRMAAMNCSAAEIHEAATGRFRILFCNVTVCSWLGYDIWVIPRPFLFTPFYLDFTKQA